MRVEGQGDDDREVGRDGLDGVHGRLDLGEVAHRLDDHEVDAAVDETAHLLLEHALRLGGGEGAERLEQLARGADVAGRGRRPWAGGLARDPRPFAVELVDALAQALELEPRTRAAEGVGRDDRRARVEVGAVDGGDVVGRSAFHDSEAAPSSSPAAWSIVPMAPSTR